MDRRQFCRTTVAAFERLQKIKGEYDPSNLFWLNSNIEPLV